MRPAVWTGKLVLLAALAGAAGAAAGPAGAAATDAAAGGAYWMRVESHIESGYFQQNVAALQDMAASLSAPDGASAAPGEDEQWRSYYSGLLAYRLALLARNDAARALPFAQRCVERLNRALAIDAASAEALALQSACLALQSRLDPWRSPLAGPRSLERIDKALRLAPDDPRVLLLGALAARDRPKLFGGDRQQAFALMQRAVTAFERQSGRPRGLPGWGAADAFTYMAQDYLTRGEVLAARNVLERALLVAPEFAQARHLMAEIISG